MKLPKEYIYIASTYTSLKKPHKNKNRMKKEGGGDEEGEDDKRAREEGLN